MQTEKKRSSSSGRRITTGPSNPSLWVTVVLLSPLLAERFLLRLGLIRVLRRQSRSIGTRGRLRWTHLRNAGARRESRQGGTCPSFVTITSPDRGGPSNWSRPCAAVSSKLERPFRLSKNFNNCEATFSI